MLISRAAEDAVRRCLVDNVTLDVNQCAQHIRSLLQLETEQLPEIERSLIERATIAGVPMEFTTPPPPSATPVSGAASQD